MSNTDRDTVEAPAVWPQPQPRKVWPFMVQRHGEAANEPLCRYLVIVGNPGERGYQRTVMEAYCDDELLTPEKAGVLHDLAQSLGLGFKFRPVTCRDPETIGSKWEHDLHFRDGRDPEVKRPHYECKRCGECHETETEFA